MKTSITNTYQSVMMMNPIVLKSCGSREARRPGGINKFPG